MSGKWLLPNTETPRTMPGARSWPTFVEDPLAPATDGPGWSRAVARGDVADAPSPTHPVEATDGTGSGRSYVTRAYAERRLASTVTTHDDPASSLARLVARLDAGEVVNGWAGTYRLVTT